MGWVQDMEAEAERTVQEQAEINRLMARAAKLGLTNEAQVILARPFEPRITTMMLRDALDKVEESRRKQSQQSKSKGSKAQTSGKEEGARPQAPEGVPQEIWDDMTDAERQQYTQETVALEQQAADPFGDADYEANEGWRYDDFSLDMGEELSHSYAYRNTLLRETPDDPFIDPQKLANLPSWKKGTKAKASGVTPRDYIARVKTMEPDELEAFQRDLYAAGFYGSVQGQRDQEPIWGAPDEPTTAAVRLLAYHTMQYKGKLSIVEVLDRYRSKVDVNGDGIPDSEEKEKPKPIIRLTSPIDQAAAAQDQAVQLMGRRLGAGEVGSATGGYNALEASYQQASQQAEIDNAGGTFVGAPSLTAFTEQKIREQWAPEVDSYTYLGVVNALMQRLGLAG